MNYPRIVNAIFNTPWAIQRPWLGTIFSILHAHEFGASDHSTLKALTESGWDAMLHRGGELVAGRGRVGGGRFGIARWGRHHGRITNFSAAIHAKAMRQCEDDPGKYYEIVADEESALDGGQVLHVFGSGILGKHLSSMDEMCSGGLSVDRIQAALKLARDDDNVSAVMLHLDTPGGVATGMMETAALMRQVKAVKSTAWFCDSLTASAGIWCAANADVGYLTPSAEVGSIGVFCAHLDYTEYCKQKGIKVDLITDGSTYKGAGAYGVALTPEQRADIEQGVKDCSAAFKADVRMGRPDIADAAMQGQCFTGQQAVAAKLSDSVVNDLEDALADLAASL